MLTYTKTTRKNSYFNTKALVFSHAGHNNAQVVKTLWANLQRICPPYLLYVHSFGFFIVHPLFPNYSKVRSSLYVIREFIDWSVLTDCFECEFNELGCTKPGYEAWSYIVPVKMKIPAMSVFWSDRMRWEERAEELSIRDARQHWGELEMYRLVLVQIKLGSFIGELLS